MLYETIQRFNGPNIGFTLGNFMELTSMNVFKVIILNRFELIINVLYI